MCLMSYRPFIFFLVRGVSDVSLTHMRAKEKSPHQQRTKKRESEEENLKDVAAAGLQRLFAAGTSVAAAAYQRRA
jgi:hypothetical protein